ncbi:DUF2937 family protein [Fulvimarina sp. MAC8]|uniref:DUF2937 family protein n=1 Tax=Fulvimarina sp. MAC8 TaxID=3162874 RepID=UPI0032EC833C
MITALAARLVAALGLMGAASQSAEFTQQYLQRLGGAADELAATVERFDESVEVQGLDRGSALDRLRGNSDPFVASQGDQMGETIARAELVGERYRELRETSPLFRPFVALTNPDWAIADRVMDDFRPALPVTMDGFVLTATGFLLGWAAGASGHGAVRMRKQRRNGKSGASDAGQGEGAIAVSSSAHRPDGERREGSSEHSPRRLRGRSADQDML